MSCENRDCSYYLSRSIELNCLDCFKRHCECGFRWNKDTVTKILKENRPRLFNHYLETMKSQPNHPNIPSEIWNACPTSYEVATITMEHRNVLWHDRIREALCDSSNAKNISLLKHAIRCGNEEACEIILSRLKPRTTENARKKDMFDFMNAAVYSRCLAMIMWVERTFNTSTRTAWPSEWVQYGDHFLVTMFKNKKMYSRLHMFTETLDYVFNDNGTKAMIYDFDTAAKTILKYDQCYNLFRSLWFKGGRESARPSWKNYCIRFNRTEELRLIHEVCPEWPADFSELCSSIPGYRSWERRQFKNWALMNGLDRVRYDRIQAENARIQQRQATAAPVEDKTERVTNLQKALAVIEDCDLPEGKYLELCNLLMDVHRRGVRA